MIAAEAVYQSWRDSPDLAKSRPWPYRPQPRPDELLSSWFLRVAHGLELKPYTLAHLTWRSTPPLLTRDIDNFADPRVVGAMAAKTDVSTSRAWATTLAANDGLLVERYAPGGKNAWVLQLGVRHRARNLAGLQYCPACLRDTGYFRRAWRLGFVTCCVAHSCRLLDRCSACNATLEPHRAASLHLCSRCNADLREAEVLAAIPRVMEMQTRSLSVLKRGWGRLGSDYFGWSHLYFESLRIIAKTVAFGARSEALRRTIARRWGGDPSPYPWTMGRSLEHLGVGDRHRLFDLVAALIKQWPNRLIIACQEARVWRSWFLRDQPNPPYVVAKIVNEHLSLGFYKPSEAEIGAALAYLRNTDGPATMSRLRELVGDCQVVPTLFKTDAVKRLHAFADELLREDLN